MDGRKEEDEEKVGNGRYDAIQPSCNQKRDAPIGPTLPAPQLSRSLLTLSLLLSVSLSALPASSSASSASSSPSPISIPHPQSRET